jgi:hypothetical protein
MTYRDTFNQQKEAGKWEAAAGIANAALATDTLCNRKTWTGLAITAELEVLFARKPAILDVADQEQQVAAYQRLRLRAAQAAVPFPSHTDIAERAYTAGQYLLAKTAFEDAFRAGDFTTANDPILRRYAIALYFLGDQYAKGSGVTHEQGLRLLVAADVIDSHTHAEPQMAQAELRTILGKHPRPKPADTPIVRVLLTGGS